MSEYIRPGHIFTIGGVYHSKANPDRKWFQFWKPRMVADLDRPMTYMVSAVTSSVIEVSQ